ncbi:MAG: aminoglycoside phosphotransferase family protein [Clostridiales bacterium]|nr:aminoglycoside phosphotransferase family protein [Clostridiales bacterium]
MVLSAVRAFRISAPAVSCTPYGNGHINQTYLVVCEDGHRYILQKMNRVAFPDVELLMRNIERVTGYLAQFDEDGRHTLHLIPCTAGGHMHIDAEDGAWRMYEFVEGSYCLERIEDSAQFYKSAQAFGGFQKQLSGFPAKELGEVIRRFHDTPDRFGQLHEAIDMDVKDRAATCGREIELALGMEYGADALVKGMASGRIPTRVTHNDTKLNNVLFDRETDEPLCVIDLDTIMPGCMAYDFGDSIRFGATTAAEDEADLDRVHFVKPLFDAYAGGFLSACGEALSGEEELMSLAEGARLMTLECGIRFLADYLKGDVYFHTAYPEHNLVRARTQLKLTGEMGEVMDEMKDTLVRTARSYRAM